MYGPCGCRFEAIRYGDRPDVKARWTQVVENALDYSKLRGLPEEKALAHDAMDACVRQIRADMERAETRLQPHYIESFFNEAFKCMGISKTTTKRADTRSHMFPPKFAIATG